MYRILTFLLACGFLFLTQESYSYINPEQAEGQDNEEQVTYREDCTPSTIRRELDVNNVRALLLGGGDKWWDLDGTGRYIVPNVSAASGIPQVSSIFAGSVWLGGFDPSGNLKVAAQTYRDGSNNDFYPGPLTDEGTTTAETCSNWDEMFEVRGWEIDSLIRMYESGRDFSIEEVPDGVRYYPALGNNEEFFDEYDFNLPDAEQGLGSFHDENGDGFYNPLDGDHPAIDIRGCPISSDQVPNQMLFWIYNDNGGPHTNTQGSPLRMEVQVQAFAFSTNDEINNMTFYRYKLINRAIQTIDSTYFAMWTDPDLGCTTDDYIGCDTSRNLMYTYNQDATDGEPGCTCAASGDPTYCNEVPMVGIDYFRGPLGPKVINSQGDLVNPGLGEQADTIVELGMSSFAYYNNGGLAGTNPDPATVDPETAIEYYRYLSGSWKDGTPITFGGSGYNTGAGDEDRIPYVFTDPPTDNSGWSMCTADLSFNDRRTIQASGPFRLDPGKVNELIVGVVWVPDIDYPCPSLSKILDADEKAQALFDNCFDLTEGPDAPDVEIIELDEELVFVMTNDTVTSNNAYLKYTEKGLEIPPTEPDSLYRFQGYQVYQLANQTVDKSLTSLRDPTKARLVFQCDIKDSVSQVYNWEPRQDPTDPSKQVFVPELQADGANQGVRHTFRITEDQFAETDNRGLINQKDYYYTVIAYAHNNYDTFNFQENTGQPQPYLAGSGNTAVYTGTPHPIVHKKLNTSYGEGAVVKRLDGLGSGGHFLEITEASEQTILDNGSVDTVTYEMNNAPIEINTYNPIDVVPGEYQIDFIDNDLTDGTLENNAHWRITKLSNGQTYTSDRSINRINEQILGNWGFSVTISQVTEPGVMPTVNDDNGFVGAEIEYVGQNVDEWYTHVTDGTGLFNFIQDSEKDQWPGVIDPNGVYSDAQNVMYPFIMCEGQDLSVITPGWSNSQFNQLIGRSDSLESLNNVDIVLTSDKSKWSRCVVMETVTQPYLAQGGGSIGDAENMHIRESPSVSKEVDADGNPQEDDSGTIGKAWFPGYAINVETGERVNIFFGENSFYRPDNFLLTNVPDSLLTGGDMMFNPHSTVLRQVDPDNPNAGGIANFIMGGHHKIYVTNQPYDSCNAIHENLTFDGRPPIEDEFRKRVYLDITWANISMLDDIVNELPTYSEGLIPDDLRIKMRVNNPYQVEEYTGVNNGHNAYSFSLDGADSRNLVEEEQDNALDQIRVVPNPYYAYSPYETSTLDNQVKITNLPDKCTITIYSLDGRYIREYERNLNRQPVPGNNPGAVLDQTTPDLNWDLRNFSGIPVGSGVYLIHVKAPGIGERVLKWFGIQRAFDASQF